MAVTGNRGKSITARRISPCHRCHQPMRKGTRIQSVWWDGKLVWLHPSCVRGQRDPDAKGRAWRNPKAIDRLNDWEAALIAQDKLQRAYQQAGPAENTTP